MLRCTPLALALCCAALTVCGQDQSTKDQSAQPSPVEPAEIGEIRNVHRCGTLLMAGQPTVADFELLSKQGVKCVVTFRTEGEVSWDEQAAVEKAGMEFKAIPYATIDSLTDEVFAASRKVLKENKGQPLLLHCGAATRVAAVWLAYRVLDEQVSLEKALAEAEKIGLRSKALRERALEYIEAQSK